MDVALPVGWHVSEGPPAALNDTEAVTAVRAVGSLFSSKGMDAPSWFEPWKQKVKSLKAEADAAKAAAREAAVAPVLEPRSLRPPKLGPMVSSRVIIS